MMYSLQKFDTKILNFIDKYLRCKILDKLMPLITSLGNGAAVWIIISLYLINNKCHKNEGYMVIASLILTTISGEGIIKHLFRRARPFIKMKKNKLLIAKPITYSFPSGHTASSFAAAGIFIMTNDKASIYMIILASLIAFSRLYLNVHYPSDVVIGIILGIICSKIVVFIFCNMFINALYIFNGNFKYLL